MSAQPRPPGTPYRFPTGAPIDNHSWRATGWPNGVTKGT